MHVIHFLQSLKVNDNRYCIMTETKSHDKFSPILRILVDNAARLEPETVLLTAQSQFISLEDIDKTMGIIPWDIINVSHRQDIRMWFIKKHASEYFLNWSRISMCIPEEDVRQYPDEEWNYYHLSQNSKISMRFALEHKDKEWDWEIAGEFLQFTPDSFAKYIELFPDNIMYVSCNRSITYQIVDRFPDLDWGWMSLSQFMPFAYMAERKHRWDWDTVAHRDDVPAKLLPAIGTRSAYRHASKFIDPAYILANPSPWWSESRLAGNTKLTWAVVDYFPGIKKYANELVQNPALFGPELFRRFGSKLLYREYLIKNPRFHPLRIWSENKCDGVLNKRIQEVFDWRDLNDGKKVCARIAVRYMRKHRRRAQAVRLQALEEMGWIPAVARVVVRLL